MAIPDTKEKYQETILPDTLYYVKNSGIGTERQGSMCAVKGGEVNVYGSLSKPTVPVVNPATDMILDTLSSPLTGIVAFGVVPTFLYFETASGTPIITLSSIGVELVPDP